MEFKRGTRRLVIIVAYLGIVIKLPIIDIGKTIKSIFKLIFYGDFSTLYILSTTTQLDNDAIRGYKSNLFGGIMDNWREFSFFVKTTHPFLQPTYFSFLGLINIQKYGEHPKITMRSLWKQLCEITDNGTYGDPHHFQNPSNFCLANGKLKICDYSRKKTQKIITEYGSKIQDSFSQNYVEKT